MYSLNVPIPGEVARLANDLAPSLFGFETVRERHTLVAKRFGDSDRYDRLENRVRTALVGTPAFEARIAGIDHFDRPARGDGPVVYLAVESPGLRRLHRRLCSAFDPVPGIEGDDYVPHVTLARGGNNGRHGGPGDAHDGRRRDAVETAERLAEREIDPVEWTVDRLHLWDATYEEPTATVPLPA